MNDSNTFDKTASDALKTEVLAAVDEVMTTDVASKDEAINALIAKLETLKDNPEGGEAPEMGGMGTEGAMNIPGESEENA